MRLPTPLLVPLSLMPICMFVGVAAQSIGLYSLLLFAPAIVFARRLAPLDADTGRRIRHLCTALLLCFAVFPLANLLALPRAPGATIAQLPRVFFPPWRDILASRVSSMVALSATFFLVFISAVVGTWRRGKDGRSHGPRDVALTAARADGRLARSWLDAFHRAMLCASLAWVGYLVFQHVTGFDYRRAGGVLAEEHRMASGRFRVFGFYGHPLSAGSVGLAFLTFYWSLFWRSLALPTAEKSALWGRIPASRPLTFVALVALHACAVVVSGGRTVLAASVVMLCVVPLTVRLPSPWARLRWALLGILPAAAAVAVVTTPLGVRLQRTFASGVIAGLGDRPKFWSVYAQMFLDKPILGHGAAFIDRGDRTRYYEELGFASLKDKFNAHNIYLETLANTGALGAILLAGFLVLFFWRLRLLGEGRGNALLRDFRISFLLAFVANLLHGFTQNTYFDANVNNPYLVLLWVFVWACVFWSSDRERHVDNATR